MACALLSSAYLAPVQYYTKFIIYDELVIEACENYSKQTFRNRCIIAGANGPQVLSIPIVKETRLKIPINEALIDYESGWQRIHIRSIESAYKNSPFFEYYIDELFGIYKANPAYLLELNNALHTLVLKLLGIESTLALTQEFLQPGTSGNDFREKIHPKPSKQKADSRFTPYPYSQVFSERHGFLPNLSIIDLMFNEGPQSLSILKQSCRP